MSPTHQKILVANSSNPIKSNLQALVDKDSFELSRLFRRNTHPPPHVWNICRFEGYFSIPLTWYMVPLAIHDEVPHSVETCIFQHVLLVLHPECPTTLEIFPLRKQQLPTWKSKWITSVELFFLLVLKKIGGCELVFLLFSEGVTHLWEIGHRDGWFVEQLEFSAHFWAEIPCLVYLFRKLSSSFLTWYSEPSKPKHLLIQDQNSSSEQRKSDKSDFPSSIDYISWGCNLPFLPFFCQYFFFRGNVETKLPPLHSPPFPNLDFYTPWNQQQKSLKIGLLTPNRKQNRLPVFQHHPFSGVNLQLQGR